MPPNKGRGDNLISTGVIKLTIMRSLHNSSQNIQKIKYNQTIKSIFCKFYMAFKLIEAQLSGQKAHSDPFWRDCAKVSILSKSIDRDLTHWK